MSIKLVPAKDLDTDKWDAVIDSDPNALIYSYSWYLDMTGEDWDALVLNDYETILPVIYRKKYGISYIFRPSAVQQIGLAGANSDSPELLAQFLESIPTKYKVVDIFTNVDNSPAALPKQWKMTQNVNLVLDLSTSYEKIYSNFTQNTKRNIKKASKFGLHVFEHDPPEVLTTLFKANQGEKYTTPDDFFQKTLHVMHVLIHKGIGKVWTVHDERNSPIAGIFVMEHKGRATLLFTATDELGKERQAVSYLINEYLIYGSNRLETFDFEGSNLTGIRRFYQGFGATATHYYHLHRNRLPLLIRWLK